MQAELAQHAALVDQQKQADIKEACAKLMQANKALSFEQAWEMLKKSRPDLFKSGADSYTESLQPKKPAVKVSSAVMKSLLC